MTKKEFEEQINRLIDTYGAKAYPAERIKGIWQAFKHFHIDDFKQGVSVIINENYYPPMLAKMREQIRYTKIDLHDECPCEHCGSTGRIICFKEGDTSGLPIGTFRCFCENGNQYPNYVLFERQEGFIPSHEYYKRVNNGISSW